MVAPIVKEIAAMSAEVIEKLVDAYLANMQAMNAQGWLENFAEDGVICDPVGKPPSKVHEDYQKFFGMLSAIFDKLELSKDHIFVVAGSGAAVKWTMRAVGKNGRTATGEGIHVFEINGAGKIQKVTTYWDDAAFMAQLKG